MLNTYACAIFVQYDFGAHKSCAAKNWRFEWRHLCGMMIFELVPDKQYFITY
tara:strand:+ start:2691 stop:2846 length:156 start_codon:yes stop_codon:yes gene_type:complete